jgi:hypothetical protein
MRRSIVLSLLLQLLFPGKNCLNLKLTIYRQYPSAISANMFTRGKSAHIRNFLSVIKRADLLRVVATVVYIFYNIVKMVACNALCNRVKHPLMTRLVLETNGSIY